MFKKINWKVRNKNTLYAFEIVGSIFLPVIAYMGLTLEEINSWATLLDVSLQAISNPYIVGMIILSAFNATADPTTKGLSDSKNALTYEKPNSDK